MSGIFGDDPIPAFASSRNVVVLSPENAFLKILNGPGCGEIISLSSLKMIIGRNDPPHVSVDIDLSKYEIGKIPMISRRHAELKWVNEKLELVDLGSSNGTFVNGTRLASLKESGTPRPVVLCEGGKITFANLECEIICQINHS
ncbi:MAG: FHA domain-containing protein [Candidatus Riflebacteria bacterium]|nr:FHA domain-containing protein [Candidatus Riflebacteria bacterium]